MSHVRSSHTESASLSELEAMDPQKRELLEARFLGKVSQSGGAPASSCEISRWGGLLSVVKLVLSCNNCSPPKRSPRAAYDDMDGPPGPTMTI